MGFKKASIFILLTLTILLLAVFCFAQREMEVPLPEMSSENLPFLPDYIKYIFNFAIGIAGFVAFGCLIYGGVRHIISAGNPTAMADANDQIFSGLIGLIVILGSWLLLTTINPQLIVLRASREPTPPTEESIGVYLCKDVAGKDCQIFTTDQVDLGDLKKQVRYVKFENPEDSDYGVVLHEEKYYKGRCAICLGDGCSPGLNDVDYVKGVSSIQIFTQSASSPGEGVSLYRWKNYNEGCEPEDECERSPATGGYKNVSLYDLNKTGKSIKIDEEGRYLAALFENMNYQDTCEIFTISDPDIGGNQIGICDGPNPVFDISNFGCFTSIRVLPIK